jgi:hypothetical protein
MAILVPRRRAENINDLRQNYGRMRREPMAVEGHRGGSKGPSVKVVNEFGIKPVPRLHSKIATQNSELPGDCLPRQSL